MTVSTPFLPKTQGKERAIFSNPYWPVRTVERGIIFLASLAIDSTMWLRAPAIP